MLERRARAERCGKLAPAFAKSPADGFQTARQLACAADNRPTTPQGAPAAEPSMDGPAPATAYVPRTASLRVVNGPGAGQRFTVGKGASIGYGRKKNDIHLDDDYASRAHARVDQTEAGYAVMDLKSTNGTKVNDQRIEPYNLVLLNAGDQIEIGEPMLVFEME